MTCVWLTRGKQFWLEDREANNRWLKIQFGHWICHKVSINVEYDPNIFTKLSKDMLLTSIIEDLYCTKKSLKCKYSSQRFLSVHLTTLIIYKVFSNKATLKVKNSEHNYFLFIFYTRVLFALPVVWSLRILPKFDKTQSMLKRIRNCQCFWPINFWLVANWPGVTAVRTKQPLTLINKLSTIWKNSQVSQVLLYYMTKKETSVSILTCTARSAYIINNKLAFSANQ